MALEAENFSLERQLVSYQKNMAFVQPRVGSYSDDIREGHSYDGIDVLPVRQVREVSSHVDILPPQVARNEYQRNLVSGPEIDSGPTYHTHNHRSRQQNNENQRSTYPYSSGVVSSHHSMRSPMPGNTPQDQLFGRPTTPNYAPHDPMSLMYHHPSPGRILAQPINDDLVESTRLDISAMNFSETDQSLNYYDDGTYQ